MNPETDPSDESLAALAAAGDASAFSALVGRYRDRVYRLACRLTGHEQDALDVLQETFLNVYRHVAGFRAEARFGTWLYRIATNAALMHVRARGRRAAESLEEFLPRFDAAGVHRQTPEELQVVTRIEEVLDREALAARAREAIQRLPEAYRVPFVLRDLEEMETGAVAELLGVTAAAVRQRVHRARLMVRGYLNAVASGSGAGAGAPSGVRS